jgi:hypothetical protein
MRPHMRDACGLPGGAGGGRCRRGPDLTSGGMRDETAAGLCDAKFTTGKGP